MRLVSVKLGITILNFKFKSGEWLQFSLKSNVGLKILIHEPGVELLHHFSYYIGHSITTVDVRLSDSYVDITLEKTVSEKRDQGYCRHWGTEEYIGKRNLYPTDVFSKFTFKDFKSFYWLVLSFILCCTCF